MKIRIVLAALTASLATATATPASATDAVTDAMLAAYAPYRAALFRTNSKAQAESEQAVARARQSWQSVVTQFASKPAPPYDRDAGFATTLEQVGAVYATAESQIRDKQLEAAHETLERVRDLLADLRGRNGVVVYSDAMNAYHAEMEHVLSDGPKTIAAPQGPMLLMAPLGRLEYLSARLRSQAPTHVAQDAEFAALVQAVDGSVRSLRAATLTQDVQAIRQAIGALKGPYSKLFLKFG